MAQIVMKSVALFKIDVRDVSSLEIFKAQRRANVKFLRCDNLTEKTLLLLMAFQ